jgi:hypothetical protein|tara:strand:- start:935 stop:1123 length:189 start_codon:yes stop_codon:yes gene_type:complete
MTAKQQAQLDRHEKEIEDLYKDVREIKNMNLKFMSMGKGLIIAFVVMTTVDIGLGDLIMKLL